MIVNTTVCTVKYFNWLTLHFTRIHQTHTRNIALILFSPFMSHYNHCQSVLITKRNPKIKNETQTLRYTCYKQRDQTSTIRYVAVIAVSTGYKMIHHTLLEFQQQRWFKFVSFLWKKAFSF